MPTDEGDVVVESVSEVLVFASARAGVSESSVVVSPDRDGFPDESFDRAILSLKATLCAARIASSLKEMLGFASAAADSHCSRRNKLSLEMGRFEATGQRFACGDVHNSGESVLEDA